jgi:hypothetical protein
MFGDNERTITYDVLGQAFLYNIGGKWVVR